MNFLVPGAVHGKRRRSQRMCAQAWHPEGLLSTVVQEKQKHVDQLAELVRSRPDHPVALRSNFADARATSGALYRQLRRGDGRLGIIAELKRRQPSEAGEGPSRVMEYDQRSLPTIAKAVEEWGCDAVQVWTDASQYAGEPDHLLSVKSAVTMPLIQGDFIIDPLQLAEASVLGATSALVVAGACLPDLEEILNFATIIGMECIVEVHTPIEAAFAVEAGASIVLCSNFDRRSNIMVPDTAENLRSEIPEFVITVAGGGISSPGECWDLMDAGFDAVALGRTLFNTRHGESLIKEIRSRKADQALRFFRGFGYNPDDKSKPFDPDVLQDGKDDA